MISARWKRNVEPPKLASELITLSLKDLMWVEKNPKYTIEMNNWIKGCQVCFAGSVMIRRFKVPDDAYGPSDFTTEWANAFWALNCFRNGAITKGLRHLGIGREGVEIYSVEVCTYKHDPIAFKRDMRNLITLLRREGL